VSHKNHTGQRTCLGCGARDDQNKLIRLTVTDGNRLQVEGYRGRGGYLHRDPACHKRFVSRKSHYRAFHVEIDRATKAQLIEQLAARDWE
jgi:predicted RNA-binding protein YlxR (DUF448 family)